MLAPNETINYIMRTKDLDNGSFWLLVEPTPRLRAFTIAGLSIVALGYFYIGALLLGWGRQRTPTAARNGPATDQVANPLRVKSGSTTRSTDSLASIYPLRDLPDSESDQLETTGSGSLIQNFFSELWVKDSEARKLVRLGVKVVDLMLQEYMLHQILEAGFPLPLVISCTLMIVWNALAVVGMMLSPVPLSPMGEALVDSVSDLLVAILFPVLVLTYCLTTFEFDRATQALKADLFPRWSFQNSARVQANPEQIAKIVKSLDGLRFQSIGVWIARMGNNFALLISLRRLMRLLHVQMPPKTMMNVHLKARKSIYPREHPLAAVLVAIAVITVAFVAVSVQRSQKACASFPTCTMHAHRWWLSSSTAHESESGYAILNCPCRVLVDADLSPANFSVWRKPPDVTSVVSDLAASGDLEILQLINRQLHILPDSLRNCTRMRHIALVLTHTLTLPRWAAEFTNLEFLHIQGKDRSASLVSLPQGLFANMTKLTFLHLGAHAALRKLPDVSGLTNLRSITMARMDSMDMLPSDFAQLENLEIVLALMIPNLTTFPDLSSARGSLKTLVVDASPLCCNGFLRTGCNFTSPACGLLEFEEYEELFCLPEDLSATTGMLEIFQAFNSTICVTRPAPPRSGNHSLPREPPSDSSHLQGSDLPSEVDRIAELEQNAVQCEGVLYRECALLETRSGICYSDRFMPITCIDDPSIIELRRQQIKKHLGPKCNAQYEAWLGCSG
ncbi:hypothetical protein P3T76_003715 [Phytophthora citrophthora]|uniref:WLGC domain-containing protein n=1 Tax=Phytophthora citrophthora TaxID=4793 RepID=A0AAD9GUT3_9STRA|nr:hypothetical protein P3T76_003715 [Phytophthora citrophthora]